MECMELQLASLFQVTFHRDLSCPEIIGELCVLLVCRLQRISPTFVYLNTALFYNLNSNPYPSKVSTPPCVIYPIPLGTPERCPYQGLN